MIKKKRNEKHDREKLAEQTEFSIVRKQRHIANASSERQHNQELEAVVSETGFRERKRQPRNETIEGVEMR